MCVYRKYLSRCKITSENVKTFFFKFELRQIAKYYNLRVEIETTFFEEGNLRRRLANNWSFRHERHATNTNLISFWLPLLPPRSVYGNSHPQGRNPSTFVDTCSIRMFLDRYTRCPAC